jgi:hypothetical protein
MMDKWFWLQQNSMLFILKNKYLKKTTLQQEFGLAAREKQ